MTRAVMVQGTGSNVGKSLLVAGFAASFHGAASRCGRSSRKHVEQRRCDGRGRRDRAAQALQARARACRRAFT
jgi:cobyric acid synthase